MSLLQINLRPTDRQLRQFGLACLVALPAIGWIWGCSGSKITTLAMIGMLPAIAGLIAPRILKPVFVFLILVASPIGMIMGELAMLAIFFGMVLPIGLLLRIFQRAPLELDLDRDRESYWENKERSEDAATYYRQS
ncbi:MAG: SxtJ family membrane protein [Rubripirellula sp.]|nr:SxtJ family membrane protein [Rubripirellula sp.]